MKSESPAPESDEVAELGIPKGLRVLLALLFLFIMVLCMLAIGTYIADPSAPSPKELGVSTLFLFAVGGFVFIVVPWERLGLRPTKIGPFEFRQVIRSQNREQAELLVSLSQRIDALKAASAQTPETATTAPAEDALDALLMQFLRRYSRTAFSPWRIQIWGAQQKGFKDLSQHSKVAIRQHLDRLLVQEKVRTTISRKGNTLYKVARGEESGPNKGIEDER